MSKKENKQQLIYDLHNAETKLKFLSQPFTKQRNYLTVVVGDRSWG